MILDQLLSVPSGVDPIHNFYYESVGGALTAAGVTVNEVTAFNYSVCWAATGVLAGSGSWIPFNLHEDTKSGKKRIVYDHPVHRIIHDEFNPHVLAVMGRSMGINHQVNRGNFYAEIERDGRGNVLHIWPIHPSRVTIENDEDGEMFYRVRNNHGKPTDLERHEVFHVPSWMSDDGIVGKGVVRHAREAIGHALATDRYGASFFSGGGRPQAVLKHKEKLDKEARKNLREEWNAIYGNQSTQNKTAVLGEGIEYESIATSPEDNQFLQSRQFNIEEICRWYGVPPHLVDHLLRATFNNIEHLGIDFVKYKLIRWLKIWEVEVWRKLLTKDERQRMYAKHNVDALERGDLTSRTAAMAQQFFNGKRTLNEWRETEDESSIGPLGDIHFVQSAMIPLSLAAEGKGGSVQPQPPANEPVKPPLPPEEEEETEEEEPDDGAKLTASGQRVVYQATLGVLEEIVGIMLDKESSAAIQASKKPGQFLAWLDSFYEDHAARMTKALARPIRACVLASGEPLIVAEVLDDAVQRHIQASKAAILEASSGPPEEFTESIAKCVTNWNRNEILNLLSGGYHV